MIGKCGIRGNALAVDEMPGINFNPSNYCHCHAIP
jgi:hypothetical protein